MHKIIKQSRTSYFGGYYNPLSNDDIIKIHNTSMEVFEKVGIKIAYNPLLELWRKAGAEIDKTHKTAKIDRSIADKCLKSAPHEIVLCGRDPANDIILSGTRTHFGSGGTALNIIDTYTKKRRATNIHDVAAAARVIDACRNIDFFVISCFPADLNRENVDVNRFYAAIQNTSKHIMGGVYTKEGVCKVARIAELIAGSKDAFRARPFLSMITSVMSPLLFDASYTELMETACELGFPLAPSTAPMAGATSPVTLAGTLVQMNVEALSGIISTQLMNPGHPTLYSVVPTSNDLRTGTFCFGSVEMGMMNAAAAQLARYYKLPIYNTAGPSESKIQDSQSAYEAAVSLALSALAGSNYIHEASGILESGLTISLGNYVINDDIIGMLKRVLRGIEVDEESLALECIRGVGPGGTYISDKHTMKFMRREMYFTELADRKPQKLWEAAGSLTAEERADLTAQKYIETHKALPVDTSVDCMIRHEFPEIAEDNGTA